MAGPISTPGMISIDGHRKAVFSAAKIFARLPIDRVRLEMDTSPDIGGMAGVEITVPDWSSGISHPAEGYRANLANLPFPREPFANTEIDTEHFQPGVMVR